MSDKPADRRWSRLDTLERVARGWGDPGPLVRLLYEHDGRRAAALKVVPTVDRARFMELAAQSQLLTQAMLERALEELVQENDALAASPDPLPLATRLVEKRLLSAWQAEKLLLGKYKGFTLSNYRITDMLGSGTLSSVYRAEHQMMRRPVAIQVLGDKFARHAETRELFFERARAVAALDHKNLVHVFDMGEQRSLAYVVMEYVPGFDLERLVRRVGPLPLDLCASIVLQISRGMTVVHVARQTLAGIVPSDVVLDTSGVAHLLTLRLTGTLAHQPQLRAALGDAVPPDYYADDPALQPLTDAQRDHLALGVVLYYLLLGKMPHTQFASAADVEQHITNQRPDEARSLAELTARMLVPPSEPRPSIAAIAKDLQHWLETHQV